MSIAVKDLMVSVSIITYNQEKYIAKAIESVLSQEVDFKYEIIIGDDCSSDSTREILKEYERKHPDTIQLILHPRRYDEIPGRTNNMTNLYNCRGKYIAMLDGDDYWISKNKLQVQVNFLEENPEYVLTFHNCIEVSENNSFPDRFHTQQYDFLDGDASFEQHDLAKGSFMPTSSLLFRNHLIVEFPDWFRDVYSADYALQLLILNYGKAYYFENLLSAWVRNQESVTGSTWGSEWHFSLRGLELMYFKKAFRKLNFSKLEATFNYNLAWMHKKNKSYLKMSKCFYLACSKDQKYSRDLLSRIERKIKIY